MKTREILGAAILVTLIICLIACPKYKPVKQDYNAALVKYKDSVYMAAVKEWQEDQATLIEMNDNKSAAIDELQKENAQLTGQLQDAISRHRQLKIIKDTVSILSNCDDVVLLADSITWVNIKLEVKVDSLQFGIKTERALSKDIQAKQNEFIASLQADKSTLITDNNKLQEAGRKKDRKVSFWKRGAIGNGIVAAALAGILFLSN